MLRDGIAKTLDCPLRSAFAIYVLSTLVYALSAPSEIWRTHTNFNHFALLAESWLSLRLDLASGPPAYTFGNDFAYYDQRWFVVFPGFPALLILPLVFAGGGAENVSDGAFFLLLAGLAPAFLCLFFRRLVAAKIASLSPRDCFVWAMLYAVGTVYFFTAVQGSVWFAAHVVTAIFTCLFLWASLEAHRPLGAGLCLSAVIATRPHLAVLSLFYFSETYRVVASVQLSRYVALRRSLPKLVWFGLPVAITLLALALLNYARFGSVFEFGYRYLAIAWQSRIMNHGLFGYHYLARNLGIALANLPYLSLRSGEPLVQINGHGLALWLTSPFYLWLLWPKQKTVIHRGLYVSLLLAVMPSLLYQNSGWLQFGQRFSNDYAPLLFALLSVSGWSFTRGLRLACVWAVAINAFGALTFGRPSGAKYYYIERSQRVIFEPD